MACPGWDAPFAFMSTTQSRKSSLPSPRSYVSPFSSSYPRFTALGEFLYHKRATSCVRDNGMVQRHKRVFSQRSTGKVSRSTVPRLFYLKL